MSRIRVVIDGRALSDGNRTRGIGTYVRGLLPELGKTTEEVDVSVFATSPATVPPGARALRMVRVAPPRLRGLEHDLLLPLDLWRVHADVFHSPALSPPRRSRLPMVLTLHDLIPLTQPGYGDSRAHFERIGRAARAAAAVIAVSRHTAADAERLLGLDPRRVFVAPHGVDRRFTPDPDPGRPDGGYLLLVGEYEPRRGYAAAFEIAAAASLPLKVAGSIAPWIGGSLDAERARAPRPDLIELLGFVPDQELVELYRGATAVLMTSSAEGFGLPALEAMACGAPVVAFRNTALEEVVGTGGLLVADQDVTAAVQAIGAVIERPGERARVRDAALAQAKRFTWARSAAIHVEAYRAACAPA